MAEATPRRIGLAEVRASFNPAFREPWLLARVFRPAADLLTPLACNAGLGGNAVTGARAAIAAAAVLGLASGWPILHPAVVALAYLGYVLDCVDGNVVRVTDSASYWGKFIDGLADGVFVFLAPFAAGLGIWLWTGAGAPLAAGAATTTAALFAQMTRNRLSFFREWMVAQSGPLAAAQHERAARAARLERGALAVMVNVTMLAPLLLLLPDGARVYVFALAATQLPADMVVVATSLRQGSALLRRRRRSIRMAE